MRLTLRTLLALLDGTLDPNQTIEIRNKLAESKVASYFVNRIQDVLRRPELAAPTDGSLNANMMAEYLDNALPPDQVAIVEKRCLESDVQLAEAAASHHILTLFLRNSVEVSVHSRQRMYDLALQGSGDGDVAVAAPIQPARNDKAADPRDDTPHAQQPEKVTAVVCLDKVPGAQPMKKVTAVVSPETTPNAPQTKKRAAVIRSNPREKARTHSRRILPISLLATALGLIVWLGWHSGFWEKEIGTSKNTVYRTDAPKIDAKEQAGLHATDASDATATSLPSTQANVATPIVPPSASPVSTAPIISAKPNPVPADSKATTIFYDVGQAGIGEVYVSTNGSAERLVVRGRTGVKDVNWIDKGTYEFRLYEGRERKNRLATVTVSRETK